MNRNGKLYLNVPFLEKDSAKALGARWDPKLKKWYYKGSVHNYVKFKKWISCKENIIIAYDYLYILEGERICRECKKNTRVIGLGISKFILIYKAGEYGYMSEIVDDYEGNECMYISWVDHENKIPAALLKYLKENYSVEQRESNKHKECFMNYCDNCGATQKNRYIFGKTSPIKLEWDELSTTLKEKGSKIKIYRIHIKEDLALDWDIRYNDGSDAYFTYGNIIDLKLLKGKCDNEITFGELYEI